MWAVTPTPPVQAPTMVGLADRLRYHFEQIDEATPDEDFVRARFHYNDVADVLDCISRAMLDLEVDMFHWKARAKQTAATAAGAESSKATSEAATWAESSTATWAESSTAILAAASSTATRASSRSAEAESSRRSLRPRHRPERSGES